MNDAATATPIPVRRRPRWVLPAVVLFVALGAVAIGIGVASRDTETPTASDANAVVPVANVSQACAGWAATEPAGGSATAWCSSMTTWMNQQLTSGAQTGMMMWSDPTKMLATCQAWTAASSSATYPNARCQEMVDWMQSNASTGGWPSGMMSGWTGNMMTRGTTP